MDYYLEPSRCLNRSETIEFPPTRPGCMVPRSIVQNTTSDMFEDEFMRIRNEACDNLKDCDGNIIGPCIIDVCYALSGCDTTQKGIFYTCIRQYMTMQFERGSRGLAAIVLSFVQHCATTRTESSMLDCIREFVEVCLSSQQIAPSGPSHHFILMCLNQLMSICEGLGTEQMLRCRQMLRYAITNTLVELCTIVDYEKNCVSSKLQS